MRIPITIKAMVLPRRPRRNAGEILIFGESTVAIKAIKALTQGDAPRQARDKQYWST